MSNEQRIHSLQERHQYLEAQIHSEMARPHPDDAEITRLKREKLRLKDEMQRLEH